MNRYGRYILYLYERMNKVIQQHTINIYKILYLNTIFCNLYKMNI